jgi:hypothetical protein
MGCRIGTLFDCYQDIPDVAIAFQTDQNSILLKFGGTLFLSGPCDKDELSAFA